MKLNLIYSITMMLLIAFSVAKANDKTGTTVSKKDATQCCRLKANSPAALPRPLDIH